MGTERMLHKLWVFATCLLLAGTARGQDDLMDFFDEVEEAARPVTAAFKSQRLINVHTCETPGKGELNFLIAHRFGRISEGAYALWGLDNASMRMAFEYGLHDRVMLSLGRSTFEKTYEAGVKARLLEQMENGRPLGLTVYSVMMANGLRWADPERENYFSSRLSYAHQVILTRKFEQGLSVLLVPSLIHRNIVDVPDRAHDVVTLGGGFRYKLSNRTTLNAEYHYLLPRPIEDGLHNSLSLGVDIETGGHVFQLHVTNSRGMFERAFLAETPGRWQDGDLYFGFNLNRVFQVDSRR